MTNPLPHPAEAWLAALERELWTLASDERASIVAELRGHLAARSLAGRLDEALSALGSPRALAEAYDRPERTSGVAPLPEALVLSPKTVRALLADVRATQRASRNSLPLVGALLVTSLTSTDFLLWLDVRMPSVGVATAPVTAVRIAVVLAAFCAVYRLALSRTERPWALDRGFAAFAGAFLAASLAGVSLALLAGRAAGVAAGAGVGRGVAFAMLAVVSLALLRIQPWLAALAARRPGFGPAASWRGTRGRMRAIAGAWGMLVLPLYVLHALLNLLALRILPFGPGDLVLAGADSIVCALIVVGAAMLNAAVYRWIVGEPVPAPSPFATEPAAPERVEEARLRLDRLVRARPAQVRKLAPLVRARNLRRYIIQ
jgi:hypothetical protein